MNQSDQSSLSIIPSAAEDLELLLALTHRSYAGNRELGFHFYGSRETIEDVREVHAAGALWKLVDAGRLIGSIRLQEYPDHPGALYINRMCVEPSEQRRGLGNVLLRFAEAEAGRRGLGNLKLDTAKNFEKLVSWYARKGFRVISEIQWDVTNYRSVVMEKTLKPS